MMHTLRKAAVAVMFAILIVAFAISMGGNNYFDRTSNQTVAKVGPAEITPQQFQRNYQRALENLSARAGRRITSRQAQALGLPEQVLQGLIQDALVGLEAKKLGLGLSKEGLRQAIMGNEFFQDASGKFSPEKYQQFLQRIGYTAPFFEQEFRDDIIRRQLQSPFKTSGIVPHALLEAYNRYTNEQRTLAYFTIDTSMAGKIDEPSNDALHAYYEERKPQFMAPELRKVSVLAISPQIAAKNIAVSEDDLKAEYTAKAASYAVPERRKIELIPFQTKEAAEAASKALRSGKDFLEVAKGAGFSQADTGLGAVSKKEFGEKFAANEAILNTAFGLKKGETSKPVDGPLSWVILRVSDVIPGQEKTFGEVKDRIRDDIVKARSTEEVSKLVKAFEEERASGVPLADIAKKLNLPLEEAAIDQSGNGADGKPVQLASVPVAMLASAAFKSDVGVENEALRLQGGGYAWFEVQDTVKARQKPFDEVKATVEAAWRKDQIRTKLADKARLLVTRLDQHQAFGDAAKSVGLEPKISKPLKRDGSGEGLSKTAVAQAFSLAEGSASSVASGDSASRTIFQVQKVTAPGPLDEAGTKAMQERLSAQIANDNFAQFLTGIEKVAGITIDRKNLAAAAGGGYDGGE